MFIDFRERGRERKRKIKGERERERDWDWEEEKHECERETSIGWLVASCMHLYWESTLQPRYMPWELNPGDTLTNWATWPGHTC